MTWIVMTASAHMPNSCKGRYRKIALVKLTPEFARMQRLPVKIDERARGVLEVKQRGNHSVGKTPRCAYERELAAAKAEAVELNARDAELASAAEFTAKERGL